MHGGVHAVLYSLLTNKLRSAYDKSFSIVLEIQPESHPESICCDFRVAKILMPSVKEHFPVIFYSRKNNLELLFH